MKKLLLTVLILLITTNAYSMAILEAIKNAFTREEAVEIIEEAQPTIGEFEEITLDTVLAPIFEEEVTFDRDFINMARECVFSGMFRKVPLYRVRIECRGDSGAHIIAASQAGVFNKTVGIETDPPIIFLEDGLMINMFYFHSVVIGNTNWVVSVDSRTLTLVEKEEIEEMFVNWKQGTWTTSETSKSKTFRFIR